MRAVRKKFLAKAAFFSAERRLRGRWSENHRDSYSTCGCEDPRKRGGASGRRAKGAVSYCLGADPAYNAGVSERERAVGGKKARASMARSEPARLGAGANVESAYELRPTEEKMKKAGLKTPFFYILN